jgi:hypothetical protein
MRRLHLNGWQRIGIVLSVVWAIVGGLWGRKLMFQEWATCLETYHDLDWCDTNYQWALDAEWPMAAIVGLVPIPIAWLLAYALIGLVHWIRRGFTAS